MARTTLTGSRIRERRIMRGMRQAELARQAGISASYLNLIEHNRRRIGGKLLLDIAAALEVEPSHLSEGAEAALIATLREAAAERPAAGAELDRIEEFAGRFPGWAQLIAGGYRRLAAMEQEVEALTDRLSHDPHLAASLHEVLSTVTAIRSTASILVDTPELEPDWQDRFHRNISEDSRRLAEGAQRLVAELDAGETRETAQSVPQEEVEAFFTAQSFHFPALEPGGGGDPARLVAEAQELTSSTARAMAQALLERYAEDARHLPATRLLPELPKTPETLNPAALADAFGTDTARVLRRLASLPPGEGTLDKVGLVICDGSGTLTFRRPLEGFPLPRFGTACPLWPLFQSLSRPMMPMRRPVRLAGRSEGAFLTYAVAQPKGAPRLNREPLFEAHMLILPRVPGPNEAEEAPRVGVTCRICPRSDCPGRREPSLMGDAA